MTETIALIIGILIGVKLERNRWHKYYTDKELEATKRNVEP